MWKNSFKVLVAHTILFCIFVILSGICLAQNKPNEAYASNHTKVSLQTQQYLWEGYSKIKDNENENGTVTVSGYTKAYEDVDLISVTLHLQVEDKTSWKTVRTWSYEDTDTDYVKHQLEIRLVLSSCNSTFNKV